MKSLVENSWTPSTNLKICITNTQLRDGECDGDGCGPGCLFTTTGRQGHTLDFGKGFRQRVGLVHAVELSTVGLEWIDVSPPTRCPGSQVYYNQQEHQ